MNALDPCLNYYLVSCFLFVCPSQLDWLYEVMICLCTATIKYEIMGFCPVHIEKTIALHHAWNVKANEASHFSSSGLAKEHLVRWVVTASTFPIAWYTYVERSVITGSMIFSIGQSVHFNSGDGSTDARDKHCPKFVCKLNRILVSWQPCSGCVGCCCFVISLMASLGKPARAY